MNKNLVNPRQLEPKYKRWNDPRPFRGHVYFAYVGRLSRKSWTRASEAEAYAKRIWERWCRLYDAAVLNMAKGDEPTSESAAVVEPVA